MIELPEAVAFAKTTGSLLAGRRVTEFFGPTNLHKFTFFNSSPDDYRDLLTGKTLKGAWGKGMFLVLDFDDDVHIALSDGINMRYGSGGDNVPAKFQMLLGFDDDSFLYFTTSMYGSISAYRGSLDNPYYRTSMQSISPLDDSFDEARFNDLVSTVSPVLSVKALLATKQHIPGVGNGVLQDILFNARINPKRRISTLTADERHALLVSLKTTLKAMTDAGGRDTETDIMGHKGGYHTMLSKYTLMSPCPRCGGDIVKEAYMGGAVYYCRDCQPFVK